MPPIAHALECAAVLVALGTLSTAACSSHKAERAPGTAHEAGATTTSDTGGAEGRGIAGADAGSVAGAAAGTASSGAPGGPVPLDGVVNARQTGGLITSDGRRVRHNALIRAGQLSTLTAAGCDALASLKVRTVIDMRAASEVSVDPDVACVHSSTRYYDADVPKILPPSRQSYLDTLGATEPVLDEIFARLSAPGALPAIIHCVIGRDRASLATAIVLMAIGVPVDAVLADFESNQETEVDAAWMQGVLDRIEATGGIGAYLAGHGVTQEQTESLRTMALE